ncbi:MAG: lysine--tRNA ligase [Candidatus Coatesbacteria bacterium]|nr:MAG: lysine--tRNA ligase [Candidatus Coatesbacteria bacterium]
MTDETKSLRDVRLEKLAKLRELGVDSYPVETKRTHRAVEVVDGYDELEGVDVAAAGRLSAVRGHGKAVFADLTDETGKVQLYFKKDNLGDDFELLELLDLGDFVNAGGTVFKTKTGEVTIEVKWFKILAKGLRTPPVVKTREAGDGTVETFDEFADPEKRYRRRYVDMLVNPASKKRIADRARMTAAIRRFMDERGFIEIETPILQPLYGGANARPFTTYHNELETDLYLRIADELYLKRLLVAGFEKVYEIGKDFRNEAIDRTHYPEHTLLEWYEAYATYEDCITMSEELIAGLAEEFHGTTKIEYQGRPLDLTPPWRRAEVVPTINDATGLDVFDCSEDDLRKAIEKLGGETQESWTRYKLIDELLDLVVKDEAWDPMFVTGHPAELSPLAKRSPGDPRIVERFELFIAGTELANSFSEQNDPLAQREALEAQAEARAAGDEEAQTVDEDFLTALEYGMPPAGGIGVGLDRLAMILTDAPNIREVLAFPQLREKK